MNQKDQDIIRELAGRVAEIAALPVQEEKRALWRKLNAKQPERPMVMIDQVCWNEMNVDDALTMQCEDADCHGYEFALRRTLFQWEHFPVDMVVEPFVRVPKAVSGAGMYGDAFGIYTVEETARLDESNAVSSHKFINQFETEADLEKIQEPHVIHDAAESERRVEVAEELFGDLLEVRPEGLDPYVGLWDPISAWMSVEKALFALIDRPDYMHQLMDRVTRGCLSVLDQLEEQGLLCGSQSLIHCTGAYTDELPAEGYDPESSRTRDLWMFGLAQLFSAASPAMFKEFEVDYSSRICERFGLVYYGCCDPLDGKMAEVRLLPNVRKVSMSPWVDVERGAAEIGGDYVYSRKPNPALLATTTFDPQQVRDDLVQTVNACAEHGCPLEIIQKDISTVRYEPERLFEWSRIAMEIVNGEEA